MIFVQYYLDCLSQASYLIGDETTGKAVVVDPRRDIDEYLRDAEQHGLRLTHVIETHFHADFLSGHLELARATGAAIVFGRAAKPEFDALLLGDGDVIDLGVVRLDVLETPGHTPESISIVVTDMATSDAPYGVLTGDTLFIGDVGRPDLLASIGVTADELANSLYDSLHTKLLPLPDETRVFPAHGAGSACGKNLSTETQSTMGIQKRTNYALAPMSREHFVELVTEGQPTAPAYFSYDASRNRQDRDLLEREPAPLLTIDRALALADDGAILVDTRDHMAFAAGHVRGSVNVGLDGRYAEYAGSVLGPDDRVVVLVDPGFAEEARIRLARIGFDNVVGAVVDVEGVLASRPDLAQRASRLTAAELHQRLEDTADLQMLDIRGPGEVALGRIDHAVNVPLAVLHDHVEDLDPARPTVVYCAGGYRSSIAASLLRAHGFQDVSDLLGGFGAWTQQPVSA